MVNKHIKRCSIPPLSESLGKCKPIPNEVQPIWCLSSRKGLPWWLSGKVYQCKGRGLDPWVGKMLWRRKGQPTPVILSGKSQRSLAGYTPWGHKRFGYDLATKQQQLSRKQKKEYRQGSRTVRNSCALTLRMKTAAATVKMFRSSSKKIKYKITTWSNNFTSRIYTWTKCSSSCVH